MEPICMTNTTTHPNHTASKPRLSRMGRKMGIVSRMMARPSIKHPKNRYRMTTAPKMT